MTLETARGKRLVMDVQVYSLEGSFLVGAVHSEGVSLERLEDGHREKWSWAELATAIENGHAEFREVGDVERR